MAFILPELCIESVLRDSLANLVNNPNTIDRIFAQLKEPYLAGKYGQKELNRIKNLILTKQISIVHNLSDVGVSPLSFSLQLGSDVEDQRLAILNDFDSIGSEEIEPEEKASSLLVTDIDERSGKVTFEPSTDLSNVKRGNLLVDIQGETFVIQAILNTAIERAVLISKNSDIDASSLIRIISSIDTKDHEELSIRSDEQIIIGVHAKDALLTKYLYILLKFFMNSHRSLLTKRGFIVSSFHGSDFTRQVAYKGDHMYDRFYTITGKIEDSWRADEATQIESVDVEAEGV